MFEYNSYRSEMVLQSASVNRLHFSVKGNRRNSRPLAG